MKKWNDLYNLGTDYNQKNVFNGAYSDGIHHNILNPIKMNQRTLNIVQKDWAKDDNGYIFSKDYATAKLTDNTHFKIADNNEYLNTETDGWLFSLEYDNYNYDFALKFLKDKYFPMGGCSSFHYNNIRGRNYDWFLDWAPTFLVKTKGINGRYSTIGICNGIGDNDIKVNNINIDSSMFDILPFMLLDGMNEKGLIANINVCQVFNDNGEIDITNITDKTGPTIPGLMLVRYMLDYCANIDEVIELVNTRNICMAKSERLLEEFHYMVSDSTGRTIIIEFKDNKPVIIEDNVMTNFKLCGNTGKDYGAGYERYDILKNGLNTVSDIYSGLDLMKQVKYSLTYEYFKDSSVPDELKWYSECNAKGTYSDGTTYDLHQGLDYSEYDKMKNIMIKLYDKDEITKRNAKNTWQTVHSTIYDLDKKQLLICVQEQDKTVLINI